MGARWSRSAGLVTGSHVTRPEAVVSGGRSLGQSLPEFSQGPSAPPSRAESASLTPGPPGDTLQCQRHSCLSSGGERPRMHQHRPPQKGLGTLPVTPALPEPRMQRLGPCAPGNRQTPRWGFTNFISRLCTFVFCVLPEACQVRVRAAKCCCARPKAPTRVPARPAGPRRGAGPGTGSAATPGPPPASQHSVHPPPGQTVPSWARFGSDDDAAASGVEVSGSGVGGPGAHGRPRCGLRGRGGGGRSFWFGSVLGDSGTQHH